MGLTINDYQVLCFMDKLYALLHHPSFGFIIPYPEMKDKTAKAYVVYSMEGAIKQFNKQNRTEYNEEEVVEEFLKIQEWKAANIKRQETNSMDTPTPSIL